MRVDLNKFGIILLSSTLLLSGCLKNQNPDYEPPEEDPVEEPSPDPEDPGLEEPLPEDPLPEEPIPEDPPTEDPAPGDGQTATPYSEGVQLYGLLDSKIGSPNIIRSKREISGSNIFYYISQATDNSGTWNNYTDVLPLHIMGDDGVGGNFIEMSPETYSIDTNAYTLSLPGEMIPLYEIQHSIYDASGQGIKDFVEVNAGLPTLGSYIDPNATFDASAYIYKETLKNPEEVVMYLPGNNNGVNCQLVNDTALSATLADTKNCNLLVDSGLNAYTLIDDITGTALGSAPEIRMSAIINENIKLVLHGINPEMDSGDVYLASETETGNTIGYLQTVSGPNGNYLEIIFNDFQNQSFFVESDVPSNAVTKLVFAEDDGYVRVGFALPKETVWDNNVYLLNDAALDQVTENINW